MAILISLFVVGWVAVALIGTQVYFRGEQSKPIHARNWRSTSFEALATSVTGQTTDYGTRVSIHSGDAYSSTLLPSE